MASNNNKYSKEFKYETARRIVEKGHSLEDVARELEINQKEILRWKREYVRIISWPIVLKKGVFR